MNLTVSISVSVAALVIPVFFANANAEQQGSGAAKTVSKTGIPYLPDSDDIGPPDLVKAIRARRKGKLLNLDRILLHSPNFAKGWNSMFAAIRNELSLRPKLRELAIMTVGVLNKADYEWIQHEPEFLAAGGTSEQLAALKNVATAQKNTKLFDEPERATIALSNEMTRNIQVSPATLKRIRAVLNDQQTVELIGTIAGYNMVSRFLIATGVEPE